MINIKFEIGKLLQNIIQNDLNDVNLLNSAKIKDDDFKISSSQKREHGDFSSGVCMILSKHLKSQPRKIAEIIKEKIEAKQVDFISKVEVAGSGYLNFFLNKKIYVDIIRGIIERDRNFGGKKVANPQKIQIEFVSANPTGPMNVVNARAAAIGDTLANVLKNAGHEVTKEYYINDSGVQVQNLGLSVEARMGVILGQKVEFPENGYHGDYIVDMAHKLLVVLGKEIWDKDSSERLEIIKNKSLEMMIEEQKRQLGNYGVHYDVWFSEKSLHNKGALEETIQELKKKGHTYQKDGALWLKTSDFGDEKDRVLKKTNGEKTYFLGDIAYHANKYDREYDLMIIILGPDHHGHGIRMKAAMAALGYDPDKLMILIAQQVNLKRAGETVKMSKRAGDFVTLDELVSEVGKDAARFFFLMRKAESHLDFDIDLAKKTSNENPVYYVQYAYARINSILNKAKDEGIKIDDHPADEILLRLELEEEIELIKKLYDYNEIVEKSAEFFEPHRLSNYLIELAGMFHSYYNANRVISDDQMLTNARIYLVRGIKIVLSKALTIMGINAPESM